MTVSSSSSARLANARSSSPSAAIRAFTFVTARQATGPAAAPSRSPEGGRAAFVGEQPGLGLDATAEAGQRAVGADDAMAGHDDADRVLAVGSADGAGLVRVPEPARLLAVADRLPVGDGAQRLPRPQLEVGAVRVERQVEVRAGSGEVLAELVRGGVEQGVL